MNVKPSEYFMEQMLLGNAGVLRGKSLVVGINRPLFNKGFNATVAINDDAGNRLVYVPPQWFPADGGTLTVTELDMLFNFTVRAG